MRSLMLVIFIGYLCFAAIMMVSLRNLDFSSLAEKFSSASAPHGEDSSQMNPLPEPNAEMLSDPLSGYDEAEEAEPAKLVEPNRRFDNGDDVLAYLGTLDGNLNSINPVGPYFRNR